MFAFGFGGIFIVTQMHGLNLSKWLRWGFLSIYIIFVLIIYNDRGWANLNEIFRIPVIDYASVLILSGILWLGMKATGSYRKNKG